MPCPDGEHRLGKALHRTFRAFLFSTDGKNQLRPKLGDGGVSLVQVDAGALPVELGGRFCNVRCRASHNVSQAPGQGQGLKRRAAGCSDKQPATTSASPYAVAIIRKIVPRLRRESVRIARPDAPTPGQTAGAAMWARAPGPARRLLLGPWSELVNDTLRARPEGFVDPSTSKLIRGINPFGRQRPGGTSHAYPAPAGRRGGQRPSRTRNVARQACMHRQAWQRGEHGAWTDMERQGSREDTASMLGGARGMSRGG